MTKDFAHRTFFHERKRLVDLCCGVLANGKQVMKPEEIVYCDPNEPLQEVGIKDTLDHVGAHSMSRDVYAGWKRMDRIVLGILLEGQETIDYSISVRVPGYEIGNCLEELRRKRKEEKALSEKERKALSPGERLYSFRKTDHLTPQLTLVVYYGKEPWDGPTNLRDTLDCQQLPDPFDKAVAGWPIYVVDVRRLSDLSVFQTDVRIVFEFLQNADDADKMKKLMMDYAASGVVLDRDALNLIQVHLGSRKFSAISKALVAADHLKEGVKMSGFDEMIRNEIRKAREKERQKGEEERRKERQKGEEELKKERQKNKKLSDCLSEIKSLLEMGRVDEAYKLAGNHKYAS